MFHWGLDRSKDDLRAWVIEQVSQSYSIGICGFVIHCWHESFSGTMVWNNVSCIWSWPMPPSPSKPPATETQGFDWLSPESKTTSRQSSILDYVVCNLCVACARGWPYKHSYRYVWVQLRKSIDDMVTQPMMEMPQFDLEKMPLNLKLTSGHLWHLLIMICTCNGAYSLAEGLWRRSWTPGRDSIWLNSIVCLFSVNKSFRVTK